MTSKKGQGIVPPKRRKQNINRIIIPDPLLAAFNNFIILLQNRVISQILLFDNIIVKLPSNKVLFDALLP